MTKEKREDEELELFEQPKAATKEQLEAEAAKPVSINEPPGSNVAMTPDQHDAQVKTSREPQQEQVHAQRHEPSAEEVTPATELVEEELHRRKQKK